MVGIVNYGMGNLASVQNALNYLGISNQIVAEPCELRRCTRVVLPGVGAYGEAMRKISGAGFKDELQEFALNRQQPVLGICLGMQLLLESSAEHGFTEGLGFVQGAVKPLIDKVDDMVVPHVGWNEISSDQNSKLLEGIASFERVYYFVHSYYCSVDEPSAVTEHVDYGIRFDAMFECENIFGVQFHPEKSQKSGLALLQNFGRL